MSIMADVHNVTADESLSWATPLSKWSNETPDINAFLQEYHDPDHKYDPDKKYSGTKEKPGFWIVDDDHVGNWLYFHLLATYTYHIIERSVISSAELSPTNVTLTFPADELHPNSIDVDDSDTPITLVEDDVDDKPVPDKRGAQEDTNEFVTDDHSANTHIRNNT
jgi:hypothetical protein